MEGTSVLSYENAHTYGIVEHGHTRQSARRNIRNWRHELIELRDEYTARVHLTEIAG